MQQIKLYKIRDKETGRFSTGANNYGHIREWVEKGGKVWTSKNPCHTHISTTTVKAGEPPKEQWEVVEYVYNLVEENAYGLPSKK